MDNYYLNKLLDGIAVERTQELDAAFQKFLDDNLERTETVSIQPQDFIAWMKSDSDEAFADYINSMDTKQSVCDYVYNECYSDLEHVAWDTNISKDTFEEIWDNFLDMQNINYEFEYPKVKLDLVLATKEEVANELRTIYHMQDAIQGVCEFEGEANALSWLVQTQGYTMDDVLHGNYPQDSFPATLKNELNESTCSFPTVTALCTMNLEDLVNAIEENRNISLPKEATIGLFDPEQGAGSLLSINLEKDVVIPASMIFDTVIENDHGFDSVYTQYGVDTVYGLTPSAWNAQAEITDNQALNVTVEMLANDTETINAHVAKTNMTM